MFSLSHPKSYIALHLIMMHAWIINIVSKFVIVNKDAIQKKTRTTTTTTPPSSRVDNNNGSNRRRAFVPSIGPGAIGPNGGVQLRRLRLGDGDRESNRRLPVRFLGGRENDDTERRGSVPEKTYRGDRGDLRRHGGTVFSDGELRGEADGVSEIIITTRS